MDGNAVSQELTRIFIPAVASANWPRSSFSVTVEFFCPHLLNEIIALLGKFERLGTYHFKSGSPIAEIALAPLRIVYQRLRNPKSRNSAAVCAAGA